MSEPVRIDVFSDTICPWCWIGKRRLERTLAARKDLNISVHWHAFQLNPDMPDNGMERDEYLKANYGGAEKAREIYDSVTEAGKKESLPFAFDAIPRTPNTVDSHRLVRWATTQPPGQDAMVEALFHAYFAEGADISDADTLAGVAGRAGFDAAAAREFLASGLDRGAVWTEDQQARSAGITGVPCFIIDGRVAVPGAVEPEAMLKIFEDYKIGEAADDAG